MAAHSVKMLLSTSPDAIAHRASVHSAFESSSVVWLSCCRHHSVDFALARPCASIVAGWLFVPQAVGPDVVVWPDRWGAAPPMLAISEASQPGPASLNRRVEAFAQGVVGPRPPAVTRRGGAASANGDALRQYE